MGPRPKFGFIVAGLGAALTIVLGGFFCLSKEKSQNQLEHKSQSQRIPVVSFRLIFCLLREDRLGDVLVSIQLQKYFDYRRAIFLPFFLSLLESFDV